MINKVWSKLINLNADEPKLNLRVKVIVERVPSEDAVSRRHLRASSSPDEDHEGSS